LRRGRVVLERRVEGLGAGELTQAMIGDAALLEEPSPVAFSVEDAARRVHVAALEVARESGLGMAVRHASLGIRAGEIVAVAGIAGVDSGNCCAPSPGYCRCSGALVRCRSRLHSFPRIAPPRD
jgi:ABC-type uncharacterized transport system ATPase subunit